MSLADGTAWEKEYGARRELPKKAKDTNLLNWTDVGLVVDTIVRNKISFDYLEQSDNYSIEKAIDSLFYLIRKAQLEIDDK